VRCLIDKDQLESGHLIVSRYLQYVENRGETFFGSEYIGELSIKTFRNL